LWFERRVVGALMSPNLDVSTRAAVEDYVDRTLSSMPEHLRAGVAAESIVFGAWSRLQSEFGRLDADRLRTRIDRLKASRIDVVRQYVRLLEGLVLFAENELAPAA
jgi:hypothetical protein